MAEQAEGQRFLKQQKDPDKVKWAGRINLMKNAVIALFAAALDGSRTVKVKPVDGMNSIFPEQR